MSPSAAASANNRWLVGPWADLLLGCGVGYVLLVALVTASGLGTQGVLTWAPLLMIAVSVPHYGATLVRVYEQPEERHKYRFFTLYVTIALVALFAAGVHWPLLGSLFGTLYISWSPWHYSGQNFGVTMMFLRRRGVDVSNRTRAALQASYVLSFLSVLLFYQSSISGNAQSGTYRYLSLEIPDSSGRALFALVLTGYLGTAGVALIQLKKRASLSDLLPSVTLMLTHALWFVVPVLASLFLGANVRGSDHVYFMFTWVALGHAVQYLWVTGYFASAKSKNRLEAKGKFLLKAAAAGAIAWAIPAVLFAPGALGRIPQDFGLAIMVASLVNLHHFLLDGAIWKLRDSRVARILLAPPKEEVEQPIRSSRAPGLVWALGAACVLLLVVVEADQAMVRSALNDADADLSAAAARIDRLAFLGYDQAGLRTLLAERLMTAGDEEGALDNYVRSLELHPASSEVWFRVGSLLLERGEHAEALEAFEQALSLRPDHPGALSGSGQLLLQTDRADEGRARITRARQLAQGRATSSELPRPPGVRYPWR